MILPVIAYGDPVLKRSAEEVEEDHPGLKELINNMFETMDKAEGVGLAASQVGESLRLFIINPGKADEQWKDLKRIFINPEIVSLEGEKSPYEEGCLSIPEIRENISRPPRVVINYLDENFTEWEETFEDLPARVVQHEYDHIEGVLFTDRLPPLKKRLIKRQLNDIAKGNVKVKYPMKFPLLRNKKAL